VSLFDVLESPFFGQRSQWAPQTVPGSPFMIVERGPERQDYFGQYYDRPVTNQPTLRQLFECKDESDIMIDHPGDDNRSTLLLKRAENLKPTNKNRPLVGRQQTASLAAHQKVSHRLLARGRTKQKSTLKLNKGLKQLSLVVRDIVIERKSTTYKEVADIILKDTLAMEDPGLQTHAKVRKEEQNIKRRVYDALNVLISAGVLIKEGKLVKKNNSSKLIKINQMRAKIVG
jgi:hypothetical protein